MAKNIGSSIEWYGRDSVIRGYDLHTQNRDGVYYSVWQGGVIKFVYDGGEYDEGKTLLDENLQAWEQNGNTANYHLRFHPSLDKNGEITNNTPFNASGNFKLRESSYMSGFLPNPTPAKDDRIDKLIDIITTQNDRLNSIEQMLQDPPQTDDELQNEVEPNDVEISEVDRILSGITKVESVINQSPLLGGFYNDLRLGYRLMLKKMTGENLNDYAPPQINGMTQNTQTQNSGSQDFKGIFSDLVKNFPELPDLLVKLHGVLTTDRDTFELAKKKLIEGINKFN